jgi:hypothetical protein
MGGAADVRKITRARDLEVQPCLELDLMKSHIVG